MLQLNLYELKHTHTLSPSLSVFLLHKPTNTHTHTITNKHSFSNTHRDKQTNKHAFKLGQKAYKFNLNQIMRKKTKNKHFKINKATI